MYQTDPLENKVNNFRVAAFAYFGHMWELYSFWVFVPLLLKSYTEIYTTPLNIPLLSFSIIAIGGLACVLGGYLSQKLGAQKTATTALSLSALCCLLVPLFFMIPSSIIFIGFLLFWGIVVIADSPLLSSLIAQNTSPELKGTALTIVNCIGFTITIVSIQFLTLIQNTVSGNWFYMILAIGPVLGLFGLIQRNQILKS